MIAAEEVVGVPFVLEGGKSAQFFVAEAGPQVGFAGAGFEVQVDAARGGGFAGGGESFDPVHLPFGFTGVMPAGDGVRHVRR